MDHNEEAGGHHHDDRQSHSREMYIRFAAMILTAMVVMYAVMYFSAYEWSHVRWSESRVFMALEMGGAMGLVMLAWMLNMYKSAKANLAIVGASVLLLVGGTILDRTQATVQDVGFMTSMIPHHSMAITRAERSLLEDVRVCELAVEISEAQRREILEMSWLVEDIRSNGIASTPEAAAVRPVPAFEEPAERACPGD